MSKEEKYKKYNKKRVSLCSYRVTPEVAEKVQPALERLTLIYGSKVAAINAAVLYLDESKGTRWPLSKEKSR